MGTVAKIVKPKVHTSVEKYTTKHRFFFSPHFYFSIIETTQNKIKQRVRVGVKSIMLTTVTKFLRGTEGSHEVKDVFVQEKERPVHNTAKFTDNGVNQ